MRYEPSETIPANSPIMLFYLSIGDMTLEQNALVYVTIAGNMQLQGINIKSRGVITAFMQAIGSKGFYMTIDMATTDPSLRMQSFREISFFNSGEADVFSAISFLRNAQQEFWYAGRATQNICSTDVSPSLYAYVTKLETTCPCLADP